MYVWKNGLLEMYSGVFGVPCIMICLYIFMRFNVIFCIYEEILKYMFGKCRKHFMPPFLYSENMFVVMLSSN